MIKYIFILASFIFILPSCSETNSGIESGSNSGIASSYSRIVSVGSFLYEVTESKLITYNATDPMNIEENNVQELGIDIETIFTTDGLLFIGSSSNLFIFSIDQSGIPIEQSITSYSEFDRDFVGCDPVVASGNFAYVTLTDFNEFGTRCFRGTTINELRIYDISNITQPVLISQIDLNTPKGLSLDNDILFVCDGTQGVAVIDVSERLYPTIIDRLEEINAIDAVASNGLLVVMGNERIKQYDYSNITSISLISDLMK